MAPCGVRDRTNYKDEQMNILTFTVNTNESRCTSTVVAVNTVMAGAAILTWLTITFIYIWKNTEMYSCLEENNVFYNKEICAITTKKVSLFTV